MKTRRGGREGKRAGGKKESLKRSGCIRRLGAGPGREEMFEIGYQIFRG